MPNSGDNATKGTFGYLLTQYGVQSKVNIAAGAVASPVNGNDYDIAQSPLFFVRGGGVFSNNTSTPFQNAGSTGTYWSSRAYSNTSQAYNFNFITGVNPSNNYNRYNGRPLRCLILTT